MQGSLPFFDELSLRQQIENMIVDLPYPALERLVVLLLRSMGYRDIRIVDGGKQRGFSRFGGMSMTARANGPLNTALTLIQVKQIDLQRRYVDELRGAMLRWGAGHGIIVATGKVPGKAKFAAELYPGRPVRIISRRQLAKLLIVQGLGVRTAPLPVGSSDNLIMDSLFFEMLTESNP
jgi:restriction endonuclease Mrr